MKYDIFISYSRKDTVFVDKIVDFLSANGYRCWIDREGIYSGDAFKKKLAEAIKESQLFLYFSSANSNASEWTVKEVDLAIYLKKVIIPLKIDSSEYNLSILFDLAGVDFVDFTDKSLLENNKARLITAIQENIGKRTVTDSQPGAENKSDLPNKYQSSSLNEVVIKVKDASFKMKKVDGGTFLMGAQSDDPSAPNYNSEAFYDESPVHQVTLSDYYIGETVITQELWETVMGSNPSHFKDAKNPVENVSWNDCQEFIKKLNALTGKEFRLPTEAEWEYAARGGNKSKGYKYAGSNIIGDVAWYDDYSSSSTHAVGIKSPNELGLYDMSGNVWEWCSDWWDNYPSSPQTNPTGPTSGSSRVLRGGSWNSDAKSCRVSYRFYGSPVYRYNDIGFRLVLSL